MMMTDASEDNMLEVVMTDSYIKMDLTISYEKFIAEVQLEFDTEELLIIVPMQVAWRDAEGFAIATLTQSFTVNLETKVTNVENPCANAVAVFKS
jgi:hypothetical protein